MTRRDIQNSIVTANGNLIGKPVKEIRVDEIEETMDKYRELKTAEACIEIDGTLHIYADQRTPVMRVMANNGGDYYVDTEGVVVRRRNLYTPRLHIVGGNINISQAMLDGVSVLDTSIKNTILKDIYEHDAKNAVSKSFASVVFQSVLLDIVFSIDSVITAIGLTNQVWIIISSVLVSFLAILWFSRPIGEFILKNPALKILALSFLITIGVTIFMERLHKHVPKAYIYLPMGFALGVELLQMRYERNVRKAGAA